MKMVEHIRGGLLALLALAALALAGCLPRVPTPDISEGGPPAGGQEGTPAGGEAGAPPAGGKAEGEPVATLDVLILAPLDLTFCSYEHLDVSMSVGNFDPLQSVIDEELMRANGGDPVSKMDWAVRIGPSRQIITTDPQPTYTQEGRYLGNVSGEVTVEAEVTLYVDDRSGQQERVVVARGTDSLTIQVERCPYRASLEYQGQFQDQVWARTESASVQDVRLSAPPDGPYHGSGELTFTVNQSGNPGGGECHTTVPWTGTSAFEIEGQMNEENETLELTLNFQAGQSSGGQMTCSAAGYSATVPAEGGPLTPNAWALASLEFPPEGGQQSVSVSQGAAGGSGAGTLTITIEPEEEQATS